MTKDKALKLALEALERISDRFDLESVAQDATKAITAIKEALAQPEQEPVGTVAVNDWIEMERAVGYRDGYEAALKQVTQPEQEPVEDVVAYHSDGTRTVRIAPKRPWLGLTDEEIEEAYAKPTLRKMYQAIEAKLKELNT